MTTRLMGDRMMKFFILSFLVDQLIAMKPEVHHCSLSEVSKKTDSYHSTTRRKRQTVPAVPESSLITTGFYFNGTDQTLKLTRPSNSIEQDRIALPVNPFTIELWVTPEGGQADPAVIVGMTDLCAEDMGKSVWEFGIRSKGNEADKSGFFFFSLRTEMARVQTVVHSVHRYKADQLTHLAATYNGSMMCFYVNGARVGMSKSQTGPIYSGLRSGCHHVFLGGAVVNQRELDSGHFRGSVHLIRIWKTSRSHQEIAKFSDYHREKLFSHADLLFRDSMETFDQWAILGDSPPVRTKALSTPNLHPPQLSITQCGQTICDNPEMVLNYVTAIQLNQTKLKTIRYKIAIILDDSGNNPIVNDQQIQSQHTHMLEVFKSFNINWHLEVVNKRSSALRYRKILLGCDPLKIGNSQCDQECSHSLTNFDGGDCDSNNTLTQCQLARLGNHQCDPDCNRPEFQWDGGDCCNPNDPTVYEVCLDPTSPYRRYLDVDEYKSLLNLSNSDALVVSFAQWANSDVIGLSTFPWDKDVFTIKGGIIIQPSRFGTEKYKNHLVHEIGHALGLWHVHHGVSEMSCDDPCRETEASMLTGDLAEDTQPTPKNVECRDPTLDTPKFTASIIGGCSQPAGYTNTPYSNYMSYADESCTDNFTPQQTARMRCYLDLIYTPWVKEVSTLSIPLLPRILSYDRNHVSVTIGWHEPLGIPQCRPSSSSSPFVECLQDGRITQFAAKANSPGQQKVTGFWAPIHAVGSPDSESCSPSTKAWMREESVCSYPGNCWLELELDLPVIPEKILFWLPWNAHDGIRVLKLHFTDKTSRTIENLSAQCDAPLTLSLQEHRTLYKVEVHTANPLVSVDAMEVISRLNEQLCGQCQWPLYRVYRKPAMPGNKLYMETHSTILADQIRDASTSYVYQVQPVIKGRLGEMSLPFSYKPDDFYCGDGIVSKSLSEDCDDGNLQNFDGCSSKCQIEPHFNCYNEPSLCYAYMGDGICEEFEKFQSISDCGYYTPASFVDFWPTLVVPLNQPEDLCPHSFLVGPPSINGCFTDSDIFATWKLCTKATSAESWKLKAFLENPVVITAVIIHLASDGGTNVQPGHAHLNIELISVDNSTQTIKETDNQPLSCGVNPVEYFVTQDLSQPFRYSRALVIESSSPLVVISGIRIRSFRFFDPVALQQCSQADKLYNPRLNTCSNCKCSTPSCQPLKVENGLLKCSGQADGEVCRVSCAPGYQLSGGGAQELETYCLGGNWSKANFLCLPVDCGLPKISFAIVNCQEGTELHRNCSFTCKPPANLIGSSTVITCDSNGLWTPPEAYCRLLCPAPMEPLSFARSTTRQCRVSSAQLQGIGAAVSYPIGTRCKFICRSGFHIENQPVDKRHFKKICSEGGKWKGPKCVRIKCADPSLQFTNNHNCTNGYKIGSECRYICPSSKGVIRTSTCQSNGVWSSSVVCELTVDDCPYPAPPRDLSVNCPRLIKKGASCKVSCNVYGYEPVMESWVPTEMGINMQLLQVANKITCTPERVWDFDIQSILCVRKCSKEFLRDGWCDFQNNRGYCGYDGGDCCASTAKGRKVRLMFPSLCTSHLCQCLDPYAIENRNNMARASALIHTDILTPESRPPTMKVSKTSQARLHKLTIRSKRSLSRSYLARKL